MTENSSAESSGSCKRKAQVQRAENDSTALRRHGRRYIGHKGRIVPDKKPGPDCKCTKQCFIKLDPKQREKLFKDFYQLETYQEQTHYLASCMSHKKAEPSTAVDRIRKYTTSYHVGDPEVRVCRIAFQNIFAITTRRVTVVREKLEKETFDDLRGVMGQIKGRKRAAEMTKALKSEEGSIMEPAPAPSSSRTREDPSYSVLPKQKRLREIQNDNEQVKVKMPLSESPRKKKKRKHCNDTQVVESGAEAEGKAHTDVMKNVGEDQYEENAKKARLDEESVECLQDQTDSSLQKKKKKKKKKKKEKQIEESDKRFESIEDDSVEKAMAPHEKEELSTEFLQDPDSTPRKKKKKKRRKDDQRLERVDNDDCVEEATASHEEEELSTEFFQETDPDSTPRRMKKEKRRKDDQGLERADNDDRVEEASHGEETLSAEHLQDTDPDSTPRRKKKNKRRKDAANSQESVEEDECVEKTATEDAGEQSDSSLKKKQKKKRRKDATNSQESIEEEECVEKTATEDADDSSIKKKKRRKKGDKEKGNSPIVTWTSVDFTKWNQEL